MSIYLPYLQRRFTDGGGQIVERAVSSLDEAFAQLPVVVNCAGLGARELVGDALLYAVAGAGRSHPAAAGYPARGPGRLRPQ